VAEYELRLSGGEAVLPGLGRTPVDIGISGGVIAALLRPGAPGGADETLDVSGRVVLPGAIDAHVHLGQDISVPKTRADVEAETASAVAGGITTMLVYLMSPDPYEDLHAGVQALMDTYSYTDYGFHYCLVRPSQVAAIPRYVSELGVSSFKFFMNFRGEEGAYLGLPGNDDGFLLDLLQAVADNGAMANPHAENIELIWRIRKDLDKPLDAALGAWDRARPAYVEAEAEQRVAYLAGVVGASVYAVHVSSQEALGALTGQQERNPNVFIETCPHYLTLDAGMPLGSRGKVNPPLRSSSDRDHLWEALAAGTIDVVGSDHVPRHVAAKDKDLWSATAGFPGTGTLLPLLVSEGHLRRGIPLERLVDVTATRPAQLFGLYPHKGVIAPGSDADLTVMDLGRAARVDAGAQHSGAGYSVWQGWDVGCAIDHTILRGAFAVRDGALVNAGGRFVRRPRSGRAALDAAGVADRVGFADRVAASR
jgi:dihydropyrimidinase